MSTFDPKGEKIASAIDRLNEAHFWIHGLERAYHDADPFRWHLNSFLKVLNEIPDQLRMSLRKTKGFLQWFKGERKKLDNNPLHAFLKRQRNFVVHQGMLIPNSSGFIGLTGGRGMKFGVSFPIDPRFDSDEAMQRYLFIVAVNRKDSLSLLLNDEESLPCIQRMWRLDPFDQEVIDLASMALLQISELVAGVIQWLGNDPPEFGLNCRHTSQQVQFKTMSAENCTPQSEK